MLEGKYWQILSKHKDIRATSDKRAASLTVFEVTRVGQGISLKINTPTF